MSDPHVVVEMAPPPFQPYQAEFFETDDGDIISHDPHLNTDGEALYRFLLEHSANYPRHVVHIGGTHKETRTRLVTRTENGHTTTRTEKYTVTITDFKFSIDLSSNIVAGPVHWSLADSEPAYRGLMVRQVQTPQGRRKATSEETAAFKEREHLRAERGLPPWVDPDGTDHLLVLQSSQTLRQWADEYCASNKLLKEFVYEKFVHGWNLQALEKAIRAAIQETLYSGSVTVDFSLCANKICVRPDNGLSRTLSKKFIKYLLMFLLIYPFIWLFKRFSSRGGGRWEVCGGAYTLKLVEPVGDAPADSRRMSVRGQPRIVDTESGPVKITGLREGEWFRRWEGVIKDCVKGRVERYEPMVDISEAPASAPGLLDGY
ncbi:hypothetical protein AX16_009638 [Volvariella volvacea WC 439]|nr:hypothetical protein AX16_009638 [Volvariella volvacea WC 439]